MLGKSSRIEEQSALVYSNIAGVLAGCGMGLENLVKVTVFLPVLPNPQEPACGAASAAVDGF